MSLKFLGASKIVRKEIPLQLLLSRRLQGSGIVTDDPFETS